VGPGLRGSTDQLRRVPACPGTPWDCRVARRSRPGAGDHHLGRPTSGGDSGPPPARLMRWTPSRGWAPVRDARHLVELAPGGSWGRYGAWSSAPGRSLSVRPAHDGPIPLHDALLGRDVPPNFRSRQVGQEAGSGSSESRAEAGADGSDRVSLHGLRVQRGSRPCRRLRWAAASPGTHPAVCWLRPTSARISSWRLPSGRSGNPCRKRSPSRGALPGCEALPRFPR